MKKKENLIIGAVLVVFIIMNMGIVFGNQAIQGWKVGDMIAKCINGLGCFTICFFYALYKCGARKVWPWSILGLGFIFFGIIPITLILCGLNEFFTIVLLFQLLINFIILVIITYSFALLLLKKVSFKETIQKRSFKILIIEIIITIVLMILGNYLNEIIFADNNNLDDNRFIHQQIRY